MAGKKDIVEQALKLVVGSGEKATPKARTIKNLKGFPITPPVEFYRGTNPGSTERIVTGAPEWDSYLFAADNPDAARNYGSDIEKITANPDAKILYEGTADWNKIAGRWRKNENMLQYADRAAKAAREAGYDAAWFKRQSDIGTPIFNVEKFVRGQKAEGGEVDPYADEIASGKALMAEKQYAEQPWSEWAGDAVGNALNTAKAILPTALGGRGEVGISDIARGTYEAGKDAVTFPGDVLMGKQALFDESGRPLEQAVGRSFNTVGTVGGASSLVPVPDNSLRVFGGTKSLTADKNALAKAQIMEGNGVDAEAIRQATGWRRGAEGRWRYEISDAGTATDKGKWITDVGSTTNGVYAKMGDYFDHPDLYAAYPEFKDMQVRGYYGNGNENGYYMPRSEKSGVVTEPYIGLNLNYLTSNQTRNTLLHEIQHAIQQKEGFVNGANPLNFTPDTIPNPDVGIYEDALVHNPVMKEYRSTLDSPDWKDAINKSNEFFEKAYKHRFKEIEDLEDKTGKNMGPQYEALSHEYEAEIEKMYPIFARVKELGRELKKAGIPPAMPYRKFLTPEEAYYRTAGEVEARNVQHRKDWTPEQRASNSPESTQEYGNDAQYIDWNNTSWRKGYAGRGRVIKGAVDEVVDLAKRILGGEPEVRTIKGADLLRRTEGLSKDPIGFSKFAKPFEEMEYTVKMLPREEYKTIDPYDLVKQDAIIAGHISDRTAAGRELTNVGGVDLTDPLRQRGGADYQRTTMNAWANRPGAAKGLNRKLNEAAGYEWDKETKSFVPVKGSKDVGKPVYTTPVFMGTSSANSSHMVGVPLIRMIPNMPIAQGDKMAFDAMMSERFPGWPGIDNTEEAEKFMYSGKIPGSAITNFVKYASAKKWRGAGFPDTSEIMFSAMDPRLVGVPQGSTGMGFKEFNPGRTPIVKSNDYHPDYPAAIPGKEYAGGFKYQVPQSIMFPDWWDSLKPELRLPENATKAQHTLMTQVPTQRATPKWADTMLEYWEKNPDKWGYAAGGTVDDDDVNDALRIAKDVGGATTPQVFMTDAQGRQYDVTGKPIQPAQTQDNSNSAANASTETPTPQEVGRRAAEDPATFDAMMERYAVPDRDIVDYEAIKKEVSQQPQPVQQMTHVGAPPMRDIKVDMPLLGGEYNVGQAPYNIANPMSGVAQTAYDLKTVPLYFTPMTAPIAAGLDVAEGVATGDPLTASLAIGFGPGGKMAKAAGIGAANYFIDPSEAEAGPARWFSKAMEVAGALPMEKMTGQQALAMLRKNVSPEELKWTGTDKFLSSRPQVSKGELLDYLGKNRLQLNEISLGGKNPSSLDDVDIFSIPPEIADKYKPEITSLIEEVAKREAKLNELRSTNRTGDAAYEEFRNASQAYTSAKSYLMRRKEDMKREYIDSIGGLSKPTKFKQWSTQGGEGYRENLYQFDRSKVNGESPKDRLDKYIDQMKKDFWQQTYDVGVASGIGESEAQRIADNFLRNTEVVGMARALNRSDELNQLSNYAASRDSDMRFTEGHWDQPDIAFHTRTQTLAYDPPGANRPYRVHNVDETQSDAGQRGRKQGFYNPQDLVDYRDRLAKYQKDLNVARAKFRNAQQEAEQRFIASEEAKGSGGAFSGIASDWHTMRQDFMSADPEFSAARNELRALTDSFPQIQASKPDINGIPAMPFIHNTEAWTDRAIKQELDRALDSDADYFSWTPGDVHVDRYDLSQHISGVEYDPFSGRFKAFDPDDETILDATVKDQAKLDEYLGKEVADRFRERIKESTDRAEKFFNVRKKDYHWFLHQGPYQDSPIWDSRHFNDLEGETAPTGGFTSLEAAEKARKLAIEDKLSRNPVGLYELDLRHGGEGMRKYYEMYAKRAQKVLEKATGMKVPIEEIEVQTANGPRKQFGIRLTDEMREKARFSDFNRGGTVTGPHSYGSDDDAVGRALALTREY